MIPNRFIVKYQLFSRSLTCGAIPRLLVDPLLSSTTSAQ